MPSFSVRLRTDSDAEKIFFWTLLGYLCATSATGGAWSLTSFTVCRFLTGVGIGGEYAAVNSAIDELVPARLRGRIDIAINGTFWIGILLGSVVTGLFLSGRLLPLALGWRFAFLSGLPIGIIVLALRRDVPESPRWLLARGRMIEAMRVLQTIGGNPVAIPAYCEKNTPVCPRPGLTETFRLLIGPYRQRALVSLCLMTAQALFYNSIFFH